MNAIPNPNLQDTPEIDPLLNNSSSNVPTPPLVARFPGMRALAWSGDVLYASHGYDLLRARVGPPLSEVEWSAVARFRAPWPRRLSARNRFSSRVFRDGFHALAILPTGALVAAVPGAIVKLGPDENEFRVTHRIVRGTRPLHITAVPNSAVYWGEYFDNADRDQVHIYASRDGGETWSVAYTFPKGAIRHVHNIVHDPWANCLWVLTGDYGAECRILRASYDFGQVEPALQGNQQARAVALVPGEDGVYFSSDTPLESNLIYFLDRNGSLSRVAPISSSSIYGCRVRNRVFFSTMVEPSQVNRDRKVRIYAGGGNRGAGGEDWRPLLAWKKDRWPMRFFQYGNAVLPDGENMTSCLALTTVGVECDDMVMSLYSVRSS